MRVAIIGLGEAGQVFSGGLAGRGAEATAFDPQPVDAPAGVRKTDSLVAAVSDAQVVLSLVGASAANAVLDSVIEFIPTGAIFADMNTASPAQKLEMSSRVALQNILFADVAVMTPVNRHGIDTPLLVSGTGAHDFVAMLGAYDVPVREVEGAAGAAAGLKLLRSIFMKGLAGLVFESTEAAQKAGAADWMRDQIASELGESGGELVDRLISGTRLHAERRVHEMEDVDDYLTSLDSPDWMTRGTIAWLQHIAADGVAGTDRR
jgi:3-hydroxyisobutyrate dehydrogenase-like beta-hydroxyacid dehydrogenase